MVKVFLGLVLSFSFAFSDVLTTARTFLDSSTYRSQRNLINVLFSDKTKYIKNGKTDSLAIVKTLKTNGLLKLSFHLAQQLKLTFDVSYNPLLSMKIINDTLESLGYTYYLTNSISKHAESLKWSILINTQNLVDPVSFSNMLISRNCIVENISKNGDFSWSYSIDAKNARLKTTDITRGKREVLSKPNRAYWFDVRGAKEIQIDAHPRDNWFPLVTFFDKSLNPIKEINSPEDKKELYVKIPENVAYLKVEDKYLLDNIKRGLTVRLD